MIKISERELKEYIQKFNNKNVALYINGIMYQKTQFNNIECNYKIKSGMLYLSDKNTNIVVNTVSAYKIQISEDNNIIEIYLDTGIDIKLQK